MPSTVYDATLGSLTLAQVLSSSFSNNGEPIEGVTSGAVDVAEYLVGNCDVRSTFESQDLASVAAVSNIATAGLAVSGGTITIPYQARENLSTFGGAGDHYTLSATSGFIHPTAFNLTSGDAATVSLECIYVSSDGETTPVAVNTGASLSAASYVGVYGLGPISINGTAIERVQSVTVVPGIELAARMYRYNFVTEVYIVRRRPYIEIVTEDLPTLAALGSTWGVGTACVVYARKRSQTGFVADATASHISFSFADGLVKPAQISGAGVGANSTRTLRFYGEALSVSGGTAIT